MSDQPIIEDGESTISEAFAPCDCCEKVCWWDDLATGDEGETWVCPLCRPRVFDILAEVPWNEVSFVVLANVPGECGHAVGLDAAGFAVWKSGPRKGQRIPLDAHGPWAVANGKGVDA